MMFSGEWFRSSVRLSDMFLETSTEVDDGVQCTTCTIQFQPPARKYTSREQGAGNPNSLVGVNVPEVCLDRLYSLAMELENAGTIFNSEEWADNGIHLESNPSGA
jgi:hypothetical protein